MTGWRCASCLWVTASEIGEPTLDPDVRLGQCPVLDCPSRIRGKGRKRTPPATFRRIVRPSG